MNAQTPGRSQLMLEFAALPKKDRRAIERFLNRAERRLIRKHAKAIGQAASGISLAIGHSPTCSAWLLKQIGQRLSDPASPGLKPSVREILESTLDTEDHSPEPAPALPARPARRTQMPPIPAVQKPTPETIGGAP